MPEHHDILLGHLLLEMGWTNRADLEKFATQAKDVGHPLGRMLVDSGLLSIRELQNVIEVQALIRDGLVSPALAKKAIQFSSWCGASVEDTLLWFGPGFCADLNYSNRLGELLVASQCITRVAYDEALEACRSSGHQMGRYLVGRGLLPEKLLSTALEAQRHVRAELVTVEQAVAGLRVVKVGLRRQEQDKNHSMIVPLGELIMHAGLVSSKDIDDALSVSMINGQPLGQILLIFALLSSRLLHAALEAQNMVRAGRLDRKMAVRALSLVFTENSSLKEAIVTVQRSGGDEAGMNVSAFLQMTGLYEHCLNEIRYVESVSLRSREQLPQLANLVDEQALRAAVRCTYLMKNLVITLEQALLAFQYSLLGNSDIDDFLTEAGWVTEHTFTRLKRLQQKERHLSVVHAA